MTKVTKTPAIENADFAENNTPKLKVFEFVYGGKIEAVEAENYEEAESKIAEFIKSKESNN